MKAVSSTLQWPACMDSCPWSSCIQPHRSHICLAATQAQSIKAWKVAAGAAAVAAGKAAAARATDAARIRTRKASAAAGDAKVRSVPYRDMCVYQFIITTVVDGISYFWLTASDHRACLPSPASAQSLRMCQLARRAAQSALLSRSSGWQQDQGIPCALCTAV